VLTGIVNEMALFALAAAAVGLAFLFARERRLRRAAEATRTAAAAERSQLFSHLAGAVAHEVRNPLNTLALTVQFLERLIAREKGTLEGRAAMEKHLANAGVEVEKIKRTMESFVELSRPRALALKDVDLAAVVAHAVEAERARRNGAVAGVEVAVQAGPTPARVDPKELQRAVEEIVDNALDAVVAGDGKGRVEVECCGNGGDAVEIVVRDTGAGFTPKALDRAFEPYFSTKPEHAGLGLARTRLIVEAHGGRILAANRAPAGGAEVRIELPR
jgi:signal transduction histidine kinase